MSIQITARHTEVTPALREYIEKRWEKLINHQERDLDARVVLSVEKFRHKAEVIIVSDSVKMSSKAETYDMYQAIDQVFGRIDRRLRNSRQRVIAVKSRRNVARREVDRQGPPAGGESEGKPKEE